jgi:aarF domain-containing kinase
MEYRELILADKVLRRHTYVPLVYSELSTSRVLTTQLVPGEPVDLAVKYSQSVRNAIARTVLIATIRELFEWRFIQSDPNFANFLYDDGSRTINMIDFGAARRYSKEFVDGYMKLVWAAANKDREMIKDVSKDLGFITGDETQEFLDAHIEAGLVVGEPFLKHSSFDFGNSRLTARIGQYGGTFMKYRLTPPPSEAYSLHRKLAGAFLLSIKLKADIPCRDILESTFNEYKFGPLEIPEIPEK